MGTLNITLGNLGCLVAVELRISLHLVFFRVSCLMDIFIYGPIGLGGQLRQIDRKFIYFFMTKVTYPSFFFPTSSHSTETHSLTLKLHNSQI